ncbi:MAG: LuxR C-terminal-related transcriptional regulator [Ginsengibacter sp.]
MNPANFTKEFNKLFKWFSNDITPGTPIPDIESFKKLLGFFLLGESYYFIMNHHNIGFDVVSPEVEQVLGYTVDEFDIEFLNKSLHPDDLSWFLTFGHNMIEFFSQVPVDKLKKYKLRYDVRYKKKNGEYARILYQGIIIEHNDSGRLFRSLAFHTDITHIKNVGRPMLSYIGLEGEPSHIDVAGENIYEEQKEELTHREKQILKLLIEGKLSKDISNALNISKQTVDTHRKNMLHKKKLNNISELIAKAISHGWI